MTLGPDILISLIMAAGTGFGVYAAIRADLARLNERATHAADMAARAHDRIDQLQGQRA